MDTGPADKRGTGESESGNVSTGIRIAVALAAVAAVGAGIALQQLLDRRLTKPEVARLKFYRYLRERGHLES
jgi:hypothetical protein